MRPGPTTEPPIHSILRRTLAAVTLSVLTTLTLAAGVAVNPGAAYANSSSGSSTPVSTANVNVSGKASVVVRYALAQVGESYRFGATGPSSWDCSGLTMRAFAQVGIRLPHQSGQQGRYGRSIPRSQVRAGDLVAYGGHVGIATSNRTMVHAANPRKGVVHTAIYGSPSFRRLV